MNNSIALHKSYSAKAIERIETDDYGRYTISKPRKTQPKKNGNQGMNLEEQNDLIDFVHSIFRFYVPNPFFSI